MLLFCDGFETFSPYDLWRKWGAAYWSDSGYTPRIVHGVDDSFFPAKTYARRGDGRALHGPIYLLTPLAKSRTLFMGFAFRIQVRGNYSYDYTVEFCGRIPYNKNEYPGHSQSDIIPRNYANPFSGAVNAYAAVIAKCVIKIQEDQRIRVEWYFNKNPISQYDTTLVLMQSGYINANTALHLGDWYYLQLGTTLNGNKTAQPQAWAEVRLGAGTDSSLVFQDIMTCPEGSVASSYHFDGLRVRFGSGDPQHFGIMAMDDLYVCNDEGEANNTWLGPVHIKRLTVSGDGAYTDSSPTGAGYRFQTVDEDYIDTVNALPSPIPDPEQNPLFIEWEDFRSTYTTLSNRGDKQTFRFNSLNAQGAYPKIYGAVLHALMQPLYDDTPGTITGVRRFSSGSLLASRNMDAPLPKRSDFEMRHFAWDNEEILDYGGTYINWNPSAFDASEWGFTLDPVTIDPKLYDPSVLRINITIDNTIYESLDMADFTHRFFEEPVADEIGMAVDPVYEYTWLVEETAYMVDENTGSRAGNRFINEYLGFVEYIPYVELFINDYLAMLEDIFVVYADFIGDEFATADWAESHWEEMFADSFIIYDENGYGLVLFLDEALGLEEPYLWDGHEELEDTIGLFVAEPWDNHELCEEYLYPDDYNVDGYGLEIEEYFGLEEEHYDGYWVEVMGDPACLEDHILTQHWRYDTLFGMVLDSWQVEPIEQYGQDGNHTGDNPWGA